MDTPDEEEAVSSTATTDSSTAVRDTLRPYEKQLAVYLILASTLFERTAFYSILANLVISLGSGASLNWNTTNSSIASLIFSGK
jgi:hypothetical protein